MKQDSLINSKKQITTLEELNLDNGKNTKTNNVFQTK